MRVLSGLVKTVALLLNEQMLGDLWHGAYVRLCHITQAVVSIHNFGSRTLSAG
jgi:hypothetical protein